ncbi:MAG: peptidylprolyl isomerase [Bacilli bacterium]|nr:peptidylprolyl isomerase [Bacilli bacterium]
MKKLRSLIVIALLISLSAVLLTACGKKTASNADATNAPISTPSPSPTATASPCVSNQPASSSNNTTAQPAAPKSWTSPPAMTIDTNKTYCAEIQTNKGNFTLELFAKDAPKTVNSFIFLAKQNFYNGIIFHRIIQKFMVQTGDPTGTGSGGPGYQFEDELSNLHKYEQGVVAMANAGPNTNGSQFFICTVDDSANLPPNYTTFAKVVSGMDIVQKIAATPVQASGSGEMSAPTEKVMIQSVQITEK